VKNWEIIADNLSKAGCELEPRFSRCILAGEHKVRKIAAMMVKVSSITSSDVSTYLRHG